MPIVALLNQTGEKLQDITLDDSVFGIEPNQQVIYDVVNAIYGYDTVEFAVVPLGSGNDFIRLFGKNSCIYFFS